MWKKKDHEKKGNRTAQTELLAHDLSLLLIAILTASYAVSTTFLNLQIPSSPEPAEAVFTLTVPNSDAVIGAVRNFAEKTPLPALFNRDRRGRHRRTDRPVLFNNFRFFHAAPYHKHRFYRWIRPLGVLCGRQRFTGIFISDLRQQYPDHRRAALLSGEPQLQADAGLQDLLPV